MPSAMPIDRLRRRALLAVTAVLALGAGSLSPARTRPANFAERPEVQEWASAAASQRGVPRDWILDVLSEAKHVRTSKAIMSRPPRTASSAPANWYAHKKAFIEPIRIRRGVDFLAANADWMDAAVKRWGVPAEIIASVMGIETIYGDRTGHFVTVDVLATLSFDYLRRAAFFREELSALLKLCYTNDLDPRQVKGSFAGAIGMCQFMPRNILKYGVDLDGDGRIDLDDSEADCIGSVAHYLASFGWDPSVPVEVNCSATEEIGAKLKAGSHTINTTVGDALAAGVRLQGAAPEMPLSTPAVLVRLPIVDANGQPGALWRLGTKNFVSLLRYNPSYFYAESVSELAQAIRAAAVQASSD